MNDNLAEANRERHQDGATRQVQAAWDILEHRTDLSPTQERVLTARVAHPGDSLSVLAARIGMTKAAYWSHLRRALAGVTR